MSVQNTNHFKKAELVLESKKMKWVRHAGRDKEAFKA